MLTFGLLFAILSGVTNGLFAVPMKMIPKWKWENIWIVFILTACVVMPPVVVGLMPGELASILPLLPRGPVAAALTFGFAWGFGAILFGLSVDRLGVSLANSMVIGVSSAAGSVVPLIVSGALNFERRQIVLFLGVAVFLVGVVYCARAGRLRESGSEVKPSWQGYLFALGSGTMSAVFNVGYSLALPIAAAGQKMGYSQFRSTNLIWLLMLSAGSIPNLVFCGRLLRKHGSGELFRVEAARGWGLSALMGVLWGGSILLYGAATPLLGDLGPSVGWPVSLGVALLAASIMGFWLGEWRGVAPRALRLALVGNGLLLGALVICGISTRL